MGSVGKTLNNLLAVYIPLKNSPLILQMCFDGSILYSSQVRINTESQCL